MEKFNRRLIRIGHSLFVNIPIGFCRYHQLKTGDTVEVITEKNVTIRLLQGEGNHGK